MKRRIGLIFLCCMICLSGCVARRIETPVISPVPTRTAFPTATTAPETTIVPEPTAELVPTAVPQLTEAPTSNPTVIPESTPTPLPTKATEQQSSKKIAIDPGHQSKANYEKEPVGPGASELKTKVSSGTQGVSTKVPEYRFTLEISLKLKEVLEAAGYEVVMTRETSDVNISNVERAQLANEAEADIFIRMHADGSDNEAANGISVLYPSEKNPYIAELSADSKRLAQAVLDGMCEETGAKKRGIIKRDDLSGTNWAQMPVILIEAGFMTNEAEEKKLLDADYQARLVQGMVAGIEEYFKE